ncbi:MAG: PaaI family thioesterase [Hyphomicrobiaceae bacterium]|nr:MAG: PaaI family thioesterase [Hyphomicrobiaceae bacterium]
MTAQFESSNADYAATVRASFGKQGLMTTLGARIVTLEPGFCVIEMPYADGVSQQQGFFHGGAIGAIADTAAGYAAYSLMPAGNEILTVEYKLNLVRPAQPPTLRAEGRVLRAGKTLTVCRADVFHTVAGRSEACALLQSTLMRTQPAGA